MVLASAEHYLRALLRHWEGDEDMDEVVYTLSDAEA